MRTSNHNFYYSSLNPSSHRKLYAYWLKCQRPVNEPIFRVEEYCTTRLDARQRFNDRSWWKNYIFGSPWPYEAYESDEEDLAVEEHKVQKPGRHVRFEI